MKIHPFIRALKATMPDAEFTLLTSRDWCSMTFAGQQILIECIPLEGQCIDAWATALPEREFSVPNLLVADIAVTSSENDRGGCRILVEALVIDA